jgi:hypothetical protein
LREFYKYIVCPQSPLGVLKNCGAQTNWASVARYNRRKSRIFQHAKIIFLALSPFCKGTELVLPTGAHKTNLVSLRFFLYSVSTKSTRGFEKLWRAYRLS